MIQFRHKIVVLSTNRIKRAAFRGVKLIDFKLIWRRCNGCDSLTTGVVLFLIQLLRRQRATGSWCQMVKNAFFTTLVFLVREKLLLYMSLQCSHVPTCLIQSKLLHDDMLIPLALDRLKCSRALSQVSVCATLQKRVTDSPRLRYRLRTGEHLMLVL